MQQRWELVCCFAGRGACLELVLRVTGNRLEAEKFSVPGSSWQLQMVALRVRLRAQVIPSELYSRIGSVARGARFGAGGRMMARFCAGWRCGSLSRIGRLVVGCWFASWCGPVQARSR
jgi:hypothetical protein